MAVSNFVYKDTAYPILIIKKNNKNTYIRVNERMEVIVTTSYFVTEKSIRSLIEENRDSIIKMIDSRANKNVDNDNTACKIFGNSYDIILGNSFKNVDIIDNKIFACDIKTLNKYLNNIILETCKERLDVCYHLFSENIPYPNLKIRKMKSRWGVCNTRDKSITINLELIKYDIECLDYVIIHELSHFVEPNHSKKFWDIVSKYFPDYKRVRKELRN